MTEAAIARGRTVPASKQIPVVGLAPPVLKMEIQQHRRQPESMVPIWMPCTLDL